MSCGSPAGLATATGRPARSTVSEGGTADATAGKMRDGAQQLHLSQRSGLELSAGTWSAHGAGCCAPAAATSA